MGGQNIGSEIQGIIRNLERDNPDISATARVKRAWNVSVDPKISDHVTAVFVVPDTNASEVIVYVDSSILLTELSMQVELLKLKLNAELGQLQQVESLKFVLSKDKYTARKSQLSTFEELEEEEERYKSAEPIALSQDEISDIQVAASMIENDFLRDIAYAAAKANLEWQKGLEALGA